MLWKAYLNKKAYKKTLKPYTKIDKKIIKFDDTATEEYDINTIYVS